MSQNSGTCFILVPINLSEGCELKKQIEIYHSQGYGRVFADGVLYSISSESNISEIEKSEKQMLVIDRFLIDKDNSGLYHRISESVTTAFIESNGSITVRLQESNDSKYYERIFTDRLELDGIKFENPTVNLFSFNNPYGACRRCEGYGMVLDIDEDLVIPDKNLSVYEGAVACWKGEKLSEWYHHFIRKSSVYKFPIHTPINELTDEEYKLLWEGRKGLYGIEDFFRYVESKLYKIQYRVLLSRYRGRKVCPECRGTRICKEAEYVKINGKSISELVMMPVDELLVFFNELCLSEYEQKVAEHILAEICNRLSFLNKVGLHYLTLGRASNTLSGGETQRINLAQSAGNSLRGALYIIDEPTVGLHPKDTSMLLEVIQHLKQLGNTVVIVEHDEEIIKVADYIIDMGPLAGVNGGEIVYSGNFENLLLNTTSLTSAYFNKTLSITLPSVRRKWRNYIELKGVSEHNLQNIDVNIPLNVFTVVTGPSGSGKSTLLDDVLVPALRKYFGISGDKAGKYKTLTGDIDRISGVELIDQHPVGKSSRSNPATYTKAFDDIRYLYSLQPVSKMHSYKPGFFSFNVNGGRCDKCKGEGYITIQMQFLADVEMICEECKGKRYKEDVLEVTFMGKTISDILDMTVEETMDFFNQHKESRYSVIIRNITDKIQALQDIGLGYVKLGQSTSTFSGGEIQRLKLSTYLTKIVCEKPLLFVFDEPTTGLHYYDIQKLYKAFERLLRAGHSLLVIEHNMELIKCADWIIDIGPGGGKEGGRIIFQGTPEMFMNCSESSTAKFLSQKL